MPAALVPSHARVCIIGAGPSGLVACRHLTAQGFDATVVEAGGELGGTFANKTYDDGALVSSTFLTAFSDFRLDGATARAHPTVDEYLDYLRRYADHFDLTRRIRFRTKVVSVERRADGGYDVRTAAAAGGGAAAERAPVRYDAVCVCSGLHNVPHVPEIPGLGGFRGEVLHSSKYKERSIFAGKRVVIVGAGETALDMVERAARTADDGSVCLAVRRGFLSVPHEGWGGMPLDTLISNLFEHCYEAPLVRRLRVKWRASTWVIRALMLVMTGSPNGFDQWVAPVDPVRRGYHIINKSARGLRYLNEPVKRRKWWTRLFPLGDRADKVAHTKVGPIARVSGDAVHWHDGTSFACDMILLATGYRQELPFLPRAPGRAGDAAAYAGSADRRDAALPNEHFVVSSDDPRVGYIGFVRPNVGAIPPMSELQVLWWIQRLSGGIAGPRADGEPWRYELLGRRLQYGVDYGNYMHELALDIGAAPSLSALLRRSPRAAAAYAFGQAFVPFFRLTGPFADDGCWRTAAGELYRTVRGRGVVGNAALGVMFATFFCVNAAGAVVGVAVAAAAAVSRCCGKAWRVVSVRGSQQPRPASVRRTR